jgi:hypothetical protein
MSHVYSKTHHIAKSIAGAIGTVLAAGILIIVACGCSTGTAGSYDPLTLPSGTVTDWESDFTGEADVVIFLQDYFSVIQRYDPITVGTDAQFPGATVEAPDPAELDSISTVLSAWSWLNYDNENAALGIIRELEVKQGGALIGWVWREEYLTDGSYSMEWWFVDQDVTATGSDTDGSGNTHDVDLQLKKGWNLVQNHTVDSTKTTTTTVVDTEPSGVSWVYQ